MRSALGAPSAWRSCRAGHDGPGAVGLEVLEGEVDVGRRAHGRPGPREGERDREPRSPREGPAVPVRPVEVAVEIRVQPRPAPVEPRVVADRVEPEDPRGGGPVDRPRRGAGAVERPLDEAVRVDHDVRPARGHGVGGHDEVGLAVVVDQQVAGVRRVVVDRLGHELAVVGAVAVGVGAREPRRRRRRRASPPGWAAAAPPWPGASRCSGRSPCPRRRSSARRRRPRRARARRRRCAPRPG